MMFRKDNGSFIIAISDYDENIIKNIKSSFAKEFFYPY